MHANRGDQIVVETATLDAARRQGEVLEVLGDGELEHYRVRWPGTSRCTSPVPTPACYQAVHDEACDVRRHVARRPSHARTAYPHHSALPPIRDVSPPGFGPGATADGPTSRRR